ncbi:conserved membrane protein of unknown function [Magnetospirillum gryphiswaldense MSR-1 v2]|uniref:DUF2339 domain-containing protein n=1 Tax=Magnetospirillum gryphiswaldense (strain DSM 6361 / JCM 21280 / NBRC 15271 / MSR-1) TaxID=431944 RepID=V6EZY7_MAGGM|nr:DUF2339 domain-containing protein [Magnetospirillum gryphiswaldense]CDK98800.1 conserved membrane protein of unknown function [Magnetospirillum gryphiswaldense MSR-1 v2]
MFDGYMLLGALVGLFFAVGVPAAAFIALSRSNRLEMEVRALRKRLAAVEISQTQAHTVPVPVPAVPTPPPPEPESIEIPAEPARTPPPLPTPSPIPMAAERALTERWLVWLGGIALALGGAFLVKYSSDQGLLGPALRVSLAAAAGVAFIGLGHWLSRRDLPLPGLPWQVPPALVAGGAAMVFASIYAAYGLYDLLSPMAAFTGLAATAAATVLLSLGHGPFVALLGLIGGFAVPMLVQSDHPSAIGLFTYLLVLSAGALALLRWRGWWWLAWAVLAGSAGWSLIWLVFSWRDGDAVVLGAFLCALAGLFAAFRLGLPAIPHLAGTAEHPMVHRVVFIAAAIICVVTLALAHGDDFSPQAMTVPVILSGLFLAFSWRDQVFDRVPWIAATLAVLILAGWDAGLREIDAIGDILSPPLPGEAGRFAWVALILAALFGMGGFIAIGRTERPWRWAALSAAAPLALLAVSYWRLVPLGHVWAWVAGALAVGAVLLLAGERMARRRGETGMDGALAAYAVGTIGAVALAATFALEQAWLTVALAVLPAAIAWVERRLCLDGLRNVALLLAAIILIRLGLNPYVLDYPIAEGSAFNWLLYGYGIPMLAFAGAARLFRQRADDLLVAVLEAGAIALAVLLVSLEIRHLTADSLTAGTYSLTERGLHTIAWLSGSALLFLAHRRSGRLVPLRAAQALLLLATAQAVWLQAVFGNPLISRETVGETLVFNPLLLVFAAPALLYAVHVRLAPSQPSWQRPACAVLGLVFAFLWATLEIRHVFAGARLWVGPVVQTELWAYSVLYLLGGVAVLLGGVRAGSTAFRRGGLAIILLVVAKVFLIDLSQTTGIWRALSFLGLGLGLVGTGWLYRRFVRLADEVR